MRSLTIISHTEHFRLNDGEIVGLESTIREINHLVEIFDKIYHVAPLHNIKAHNAIAKYDDSIIFVPLKPTGGVGIKKKLSIFLSLPYNLFQVIKTMHKTDWVHFRAPTNIGIFLLPILSILNKKKWIKYAGNWEQKNVPLSYRLQRNFLKKNFHKSYVTINNFGKTNKSHLINFLNPCLTEEEIICNKNLGFDKNFHNQLSICFVGRLHKSKGFPQLLEAVYNLSSITWIDNFHFIGEQILDDMAKMELFKKSSRFKVIFHGRLARKQIDEIYKESHFIILPSLSEGLPKVLAEASSYGCIPIVPLIDSITYHFNEKKQNAIVLDGTDISCIEKTFNRIGRLRNKLSLFSHNAMEYSKQFTYQKYNKRILNEIIKK